jgi:AAA ATPase-like protein
MPDDAPRELLERDRELELAGRLLDRVRRGGGGLLLVLGPAGIGKTALCRELARRARAGGATVLRAAGGEQASSSAFGVLRELFAPHVAGATGERAAALRRGAAALAWPALGLEGTTPATDEHGWRHGLYWLCVELASTAPLLLVVDDLQWADPPSLGWLDHLARRIDDLPVLVVAAARDTPPHPPVEELAALPDTTVVRLRPLGHSALATLAAAYLGPDAAPALAQRCLEVTGGNPFLARQLLRALAEAPTAGEHADLAALTTPELTGWVRARLARLSPEAGTLARALAVLGIAPDLATAATVAEIPAGVAPAVTDELAGAGLLTGTAVPELAHALLRGAVLATIPPARRAELHGRAARALAGTGVPPARLAEHLTATIPAGDPWVVDRLLAAAGDALAGGDPAGTRRLVERALREPPGERERAALLRLDGLAALRRGDPLAVDRLREALALTPDPAARAAVVRALLQGLLAGGRVAELADTAAAELAGIAAHDPDAALAIEAEVLSASRHTVTAALWNARRLRAWRDRLGDRRPGERLLLANVASQIALDGGCADDAAQAALRALGGGRLLEEQTADAMPVYQAVWVLIAAERLQPAQAVLDQALTGPPAAAPRSGSRSPPCSAPTWSWPAATCPARRPRRSPPWTRPSSSPAAGSPSPRWWPGSSTCSSSGTAWTTAGGCSSAPGPRRTCPTPPPPGCCSAAAAGSGWPSATPRRPSATPSSWNGASSSGTCWRRTWSRGTRPPRPRSPPPVTSAAPAGMPASGPRRRVGGGGPHRRPRPARPGLAGSPGRRRRDPGGGGRRPGGLAGPPRPRLGPARPGSGRRPLRRARRRRAAPAGSARPRAPLRRRPPPGPGSTRPRRARPPAPPGRQHRRRGPHRQRTTRRRAGRRRPHQPADRPAPVRDRANRRGPPHQRLPQARHPLAPRPPPDLAPALTAAATTDP